MMRNIMRDLVTQHRRQPILIGAYGQDPAEDEDFAPENKTKSTARKHHSSKESKGSRTLV